MNIYAPEMMLSYAMSAGPSFPDPVSAIKDNAALLYNTRYRNLAVKSETSQRQFKEAHKLFSLLHIILLPPQPLSKIRISRHHQ
jgi:hypothetical protein